MRPSDSLGWLIKKAVEEGKDLPKTFIYCKTIGLVAQVYNALVYGLGRTVFVENTESHAKEKLVGVYHRKTLDKNKEKVLKSLLSTDGSTRIVVATTSLGMGVNVKDVNYVIHFGPPKEIEDYIQAIGRAGRDGSKSYAILLYIGNQL